MTKKFVFIFDDLEQLDFGEVTRSTCSFDASLATTKIMSAAKRIKPHETIILNTVTRFNLNVPRA